MKLELRVMVSEDYQTEVVTPTNRHEHFISDSFWHQVKALELNQEFEKAVLHLRKKHGIQAEGYSTEEYKRRHELSRIRGAASSDELTWFEQRWEAEKRLGLDLEKAFSRLTIPWLTSYELQRIVLYGVLEHTEAKIAGGLHTVEDDDTGELVPDTFDIYIYSPISKNELIKFINDNWADMEQQVKQLPKTTKFYISERDRRIVQLKDSQGLTFKQVLEAILEEFGNDNADARLNEDSIKTAYKRAKDKINSLNQPQK